MALVVETGLGNDPLANSYISADDADDYHADRGNSAWAAASSADKDSALIRATAAIDSIYESRLKGRRTYPVTPAPQPLAWPRYGVLVYGELVNELSVPEQVKKATCEAALRELASPGSMTPDLDRGGLIKKVQAGPVQVEYADNAPSQSTITILDGLLALFTTGSSADLSLG